MEQLLISLHNYYRMAITHYKPKNLCSLFINHLRTEFRIAAKCLYKHRLNIVDHGV